MTKWDYEDDEDFVADEDDEPEIWQTVRYDFTMVPTDYGELVAMVEIARWKFEFGILAERGTIEQR